MCAGAACLAGMVLGQAEDLKRREEGCQTLLLLCLPVVVHKLMDYVCLADAQLLADLLDRVGIFPSEPECPVYQINASVLATGSGPRASP